MHYHYLFAPSCYYCSLQYNTHKPFVCGKMLFPPHFHSAQKQTHSCLSWHAAPPDAIMILIKESFIDCLNHFMTSSIRTIFAICSQLTVSTLSLTMYNCICWLINELIIKLKVVLCAVIRKKLLTLTLFTQNTDGI